VPLLVSDNEKKSVVFVVDNDSAKFSFTFTQQSSQKTMLLVEEKRIPMRISLVPMRSYGDKPAEFLRKVPSGLLPAIEVNGQVITESQVIMELLDEWHKPSDGYRAMMPVGMERYQKLARLERE